MKLIKHKYLVTSRIEALSLEDNAAFSAWLIKYAAPEQEVAILKGIPNDAENIAMVKNFRSLAKRPTEFENYWSEGTYKATYSFRLKGRGKRKGLGYNAQCGLLHSDAETFALYAHIDTTY